MLLDINPKFLKDSGRDCSRRNNPVYVGRVVSGMVSEWQGPPQGPMTGHSGAGSQEMGKSQLRELVFRKTRFTQMKVMPCDPSKQFIHSFIHSSTIYQGPLCHKHRRKYMRPVWSLTS